MKRFVLTFKTEKEIQMHKNIKKLAADEDKTMHEMIMDMIKHGLIGKGC